MKYLLAVDAPAPELPQVEYVAIFPQLLLIGAAFLLLVISSVIRERLPSQFFAAYTALSGFGALLGSYFLYTAYVEGPDGEAQLRSVFAGALAADHYTYFFALLISVALILSALLAESWLDDHRIQGPEFYVLLMLSAVGAMFMAAANDLIMVFLGLEILSIALYILAGVQGRNERSRESSIKYFVLGSFASAIFLYGIALIYGAVGSTNLSVIATYLSVNVLLERGLLMAGMVLLFVGFAFKVGAAPFHQWTPDVYDGAPTPTTAFMASAAKLAAFAALIRVFIAPFATLQLDWQPIVLAVAVVTLLVGSIVACVQRSVKRMMAYSSISHAGFILLGLQAASQIGVAGALFYLFAYVFMVIGSFAVIMVVTGPGDGDQDLDRYRGLGRNRPLLAMAFTVLLIAQAGVPLTSGFLAKFGIISALVAERSYVVAVFAMIMAAVAAFFYLRIVVVMYGTQPLASDEETIDLGAGTPATTPVPEGGGSTALAARPTTEAGTEVGAEAEENHGMETPAAIGLVIAICVAFTVAMGVLPQDLLNAVGMARESAADLFPVSR